MLSLTEIRSRASAFAERWKDETSEDAEAKTYWNEFFHVFGVDRKRVAVFEKQVAKAGDRAGYIDLFMPGVCMVEHKSAGKDLDRAFTQAIDYFPGLKDAELPKYIIVSDFQRIRLYDLLEDKQTEIQLSDLPDRIDLFGFLSGYVARKFRDEDPVNVKAAELMGSLHDELEASGYKGHQLEVFLVRLIFCSFADDTGIFPRDSFYSFLEMRTREDGTDLGSQLSNLFQVLDTPKEERSSNLDEEYNQFPYVNGSLFKEYLRIPHFNSVSRSRLLEACAFDWSHVSPAIFGSMFQSVMNQEERRSHGAHYTSEENILKVLSGLFLDELEEEYEKSVDSPSKLKKLHRRIADIRLLDPACGSGNFLITAYKELRRLETRLLKRQAELLSLVKEQSRDQLATDVADLSLLSLESINGIEIEEFPARIAETALWLIDHLMNVELARAFEGYFVRLPLTDGPNIRIGDALELDWGEQMHSGGKENEWFILGNPPFIGSKMMTADQRKQMTKLFGNVPGSGTLDYVCGWYAKAAHLLQYYNVRCAFVSTNSISNGEQVGVLWRWLVLRFGVQIHFAHRAFKWSNQARGMAAVHCVIVGFGSERKEKKKLFHYSSPTAIAQGRTVNEINGYLTEAPQIFITSRGKPLSNVPEMMFGNMPLDGGNLLLSPSEKTGLVQSCPQAEGYIKKCVGAREFLNGESRFCLWLSGVSPSTLKSMPDVLARVQAVKEFRLSSKAPSTRNHADRPWEFRDTRHPDHDYVIVPSVSSERREYIPIGLVGPETVTTNLNLMIHDGGLYHVGVLSSSMHMAWVRYVAGRLESRYRYSKDIVYNNFPWPSPSDRQQKDVEVRVQAVLDARSNHPESSLADLYDPTVMPQDLRKAHTDLDKAVDACYGRKKFKSEQERVEMLFEMYREMTSEE